MRFILKAKKLNGAFSLVRLKRDDKSWLLIKGKDKYARPLIEYDVLEAKPNSVLSKLTMEKIAAKYGDKAGKKPVKKRSTGKSLKKSLN